MWDWPCCYHPTVCNCRQTVLADTVSSCPALSFSVFCFSVHITPINEHHSQQMRALWTSFPSYLLTYKAHNYGLYRPIAVCNKRVHVQYIGELLLFFIAQQKPTGLSCLWWQTTTMSAVIPVYNRRILFYKYSTSHWCTIIPQLNQRKLCRTVITPVLTCHTDNSGMKPKHIFTLRIFINCFPIIDIVVK